MRTAASRTGCSIPSDDVSDPPVVNSQRLKVGLIGAGAMGTLFGLSLIHIFDSFISSARQQIGVDDVMKGLVKAVVFGMIVALVGAYQGLSTRGGAAGVGKSTTGAVVNSIILIFIANFILSLVLFGGS